jgi:DNA-binding MarR family transcriptional regulator
MDRMDEYVERIQTAFLQLSRRISHEASYWKVLGLTQPQFHMLHMISREEPCKITALADKLEVKPSAITVMIDRLVNSGYVSRTSDPQDRRVVLVSITDSGRDVLRQARQRTTEIAKKYFSRLTEEEKDSFMMVLEKLSAMTAEGGCGKDSP